MGFPGPTSAAERSALVTAESEGTAFVAYRDGYGDLRILRLSGGNPRTIGRTENNDLPVLGNLSEGLHQALGILPRVAEQSEESRFPPLSGWASFRR